MSHRLTLAAAAGTALASTALYVLFDGGEWFWAGLGAIAVVAVLGTLTRRRPLPVIVGLAAGLAGLVLYLNVIFAAGRSWLLMVPNRSSLSYLWQLAMQGMTDADRFSPPVPLTPGLLLLGTAGIGLAALATDALAVRLRSSAVAGLPLLALFIVPTTTPAARGGFGTTLVFCLATAGYLLILNADGRERIRRWGRPVGLWGPGVSSRPGYAGRNAGRNAGQYTGQNAGRYTGQNAGGFAGGPAGGPAAVRVSDARTLAAAGRRIGAASILVALCVPLFVPGLRVNHMFPAHANIFGPAGAALGAGDGSAVPNPLAQMTQDLRESQPSTILTYRTTDPEPQYLQMYVLGNLSTTAWTMGPGLGPTATANGALPSPQGLAGADRTSVTTRIHVSRGTASATAGISFLPVPYPATRISVPGHWVMDAGTSMVLGFGTSLSGLTYTVTSDDISPSTKQLERGAGAAGRDRRRVPERPGGVPAADRAREEGHQPRGDPLRQGDRPAAVVHPVGRVQLQPECHRTAGRDRPQSLPYRQQARLLPAVRVRDGRAGPVAGHPVPGRGGLHLRLADGDRHLVGQDQRRARVAGALLPGGGLAAVRAHAVRERGPGHRDPAVLHGPADDRRRPQPAHLAARPAEPGLHRRQRGQFKPQPARPRADRERGPSGHGHRGQPIPGGTGRSRHPRAAGRRGRRTAHGAVPAAAAPVPPDGRRRAGARRLA